MLLFYIFLLKLSQLKDFKSAFHSLKSALVLENPITLTVSQDILVKFVKYILLYLHYS